MNIIRIRIQGVPMDIRRIEIQGFPMDIIRIRIHFIFREHSHQMQNNFYLHIAFRR